MFHGLVDGEVALLESREDVEGINRLFARVLFFELPKLLRTEISDRVGRRQGGSWRDCRDGRHCRCSGYRCTGRHRWWGRHMRRNRSRRLRHPVCVMPALLSSSSLSVRRANSHVAIGGFHLNCCSSAVHSKLAVPFTAIDHLVRQLAVQITVLGSHLDREAGIRRHGKLYVAVAGAGEGVFSRQKRSIDEQVAVLGVDMKALETRACHGQASVGGLDVEDALRLADGDIAVHR